MVTFQGEAGTAVLLGPPDPEAKQQLLCEKMASGPRKRPSSPRNRSAPTACSQALRARPVRLPIVCGITSIPLTRTANGEQYKFKEASLTIARFCRKPKKVRNAGTRLSCVGEIGRTIVPCVLGVALDAARKDYAPGKGVLCHSSNDDGARAPP